MIVVIDTEYASLNLSTDVFEIKILYKGVYVFLRQNNKQIAYVRAEDIIDIKFVKEIEE